METKSVLSIPSVSIFAFLTQRYDNGVARWEIVRNSVAGVCIPCGKKYGAWLCGRGVFCGHKMDYDRDYLFS